MRSTPFIIDIKRLKISDIRDVKITSRISFKTLANAMTVPPFLLKLHIKIEKEIIAIQQI